MVTGSGNYNIQNRAAGDMGGTGPTIQPGGGDRKAVLILGVLIAGAVAALLVLG
jgi:hypothetical protein